MKKRLIGLLLASTLLMGSIVGCGNAAGTTGGKHPITKVKRDLANMKGKKK